MTTKHTTKHELRNYGLQIIACAFAAWGLGSWAIDNGSLWLYIICLLLVWLAIDRLVRTIWRSLKGQQ